MIWDGFFGGRFADREYAIRVYEEHNAAVRREVPADRLLDDRSRAPAGSRCARSSAFRCPTEPYPHLNDPEKFWARVEARVSRTRR